jgi:hypothetical protein
MTTAAWQTTGPLEHGFSQLDDLVLRLKGLVLVHGVQAGRGADGEELRMYRAEIERVRDQLVRLMTSGLA